MQLYYVPKTRAGRARWMLEELALPHELIRVDPKAPRSAAHLAAHPLGSVPALVDGEVTLFESAAIVHYLAEREQRLIPPAGTPERAKFIQWCYCGMTSLEPLVVQISQPEERRSAWQADDARARMVRWLAALDPLLATRDYLCGDFTGADISVGGSLIWANFLGVIKDAPQVRAYLERLMARPAYQRARKE